MLEDLLQKKKIAIGDRWLKRTLASYRPDSASFYGQQRNRFANPVGQTLAEGAGAIVDALFEGMDPARLCSHLEETIKIRAVQEFTPAEAVSFVFLLKDAIREELATESPGPEVMAELYEIESRIDQLALLAFDVFVKCRERVYRLALRETMRTGKVHPI